MGTAQFVHRFFHRIKLLVQSNQTTWLAPIVNEVPELIAEIGQLLDLCFRGSPALRVIAHEFDTHGDLSSTA